MNTRLCFRDSVSAVHTTEYDTRSLFIKFMVTERSCVCVCVWLCEFVCENLRDATQIHTLRRNLLISGTIRSRMQLRAPVSNTARAMEQTFHTQYRCD